MSRPTEPTFPRAKSVAALPSWIKSSLIFFLAVLCCFQLAAASHSRTNGFETPPPQIGSIQWQKMHEEAKARQELYRKRVAVPGAMATNVPRAGGANFASSPQILAAATRPAPLFGRFFKILFFTIAFAFAAILALRKFVPHVLFDLNQRFNPWALEPATERQVPAKVRAEDEAFAGFLERFRVGPLAEPRVEPPETNDPVREFFARVPKLIGAQQMLLQDIGRESDSSTRHGKLAKLLAEISSLKREAGLPEALLLWQLASALEGLVQQLVGKTGNVNPSTLRAVAGGLDLLDNLCVPGLKPDLLTERPLKFLVVDDDLISRQAMSLALKKAFGQPDIAVDGETALARAGQQAYDVIFLDVQLPGMDGFELCEKIRAADLNRATPVIFVTIQSDFDARARSTLSGGNDLMGKPFLIFEITVKALTLGLQGRLPARDRKSRAKSDPGEDRRNALEPVVENFFSDSAIAALPPYSSLPAPTPEDFINAFLARAATHRGPLRELCQKILQAPDEETRQNLLADGFLRINSLVARNGVSVVHPAYQVCSALEGLFKKMLQDSKHSTPSMLATAAAAVDLLDKLCAPDLKADLAVNPPIHILVVDDDLVARRVIVGALQTVFSRPENVENGEAALVLAAEKPFDVIFLDVQMPGMNGFEVCSKIRETVPNRATPIVFVTAHGDSETRERMSRHGGNDLMGKPFLTSEITVKALTFALRNRLEQLKTQSVAGELV